MSNNIADAEAVTTSQSNPEKCFYAVFLAFKRPDQRVSLFIGDGTSGCGVYSALAEIFQRTPREIYDIMSDLAFEGGDGFMQQYLSLKDASDAAGKASLFAHISQCVCFRTQEAYFHIERR